MVTLTTCADPGPVLHSPTKTALSLSALHFLFHLEPISPSCLVPRGNTLLGALDILPA